MRRQKHVHKYHKIDLRYAKVWACALPDCTHYIPKHMETIIQGKNSICWNCSKEFILDADSLNESRPRCFDCRNPTLDAHDLDALLKNEL